MLKVDRTRRLLILFILLHLVFQGSLDLSASETTIHCRTSNLSLKDLIWTFNHTDVILKKSQVSYTVSQGWKPQVKNVSESGSLTLTDLSPDHIGIYTCVLSNEDETSVTNTYLSHISQGEVA